jgi:hypothetical protein
MKSTLEHPMSHHPSTIVFLLFVVVFAIIALCTQCCSTSTNDVKIIVNKPQKPFIIIAKFYITRNKDQHIMNYYYIDKNGNEFRFQEMDFAYHIGDTIK